VTSITDAVKSLRTLTYHPTFNKMTSITDALGNLTTFEYYPWGNPARITAPRGAPHAAVTVALKASPKPQICWATRPV
jgi:YD repeat-containing protein